MPTPAETIATLKIKLFWQEHTARDARDKWEAGRERVNACEARVEQLKAQIAELEAQQSNTEDRT